MAEQTANPATLATAEQTDTKEENFTEATEKSTDARKSTQSGGADVGSCDFQPAASLHISYRELDTELAGALQKFDKRGTGTVNYNDLHAAADAMQKQGETNRLLRRIIIILVFVIFIQAWATFGMSYWSSSLVKDTNTQDSGAGVALTGAGTDAIMQVRPATDSGIALQHALVLDMEHLRTMDEIAYRIDNFTVRSEKVVAVDKYEGNKGSDVKVTILTGLQNKIVLSAEGVELVNSDGQSEPMCGELRCANFKVNDPELDSDVLDAKLEEILVERESEGRRLAGARRLGRGNCRPTMPRRRRTKSGRR